MAFKVKLVRRNVPDEELLDDVRRVSQSTGRNTVTIEKYNESGQYHATTLTRRFGSWFGVLEKAGLDDSRARIGIPDESLFENLRDVWFKLARQPKYAEFKKPLSRYSCGTYEKRFGSWSDALLAFEKWAADDADGPREDEPVAAADAGDKPADETPRGSRQPSERLRFAVLLRDGFTCQSCGASPLNERNVELHLDHIVPWSRGGPTTKANLVTRCSRCNLGKGAAFEG
jgi:hypothetical protein